MKSLQSTIIRSPVDYQKAVQNLVALQADGRATTDPVVQAVVEAIEHYQSVTNLWDRNPAAALVDEKGQPPQQLARQYLLTSNKIDI